MSVVSSVLSVLGMTPLLREVLFNTLLSTQTRRLIYDRKVPKSNTFDFIIVGASPSGCVIANRLTEDPDQQVLLVEAGTSDGYITDIPALNAYLVFSKDYNWNFTTQYNPRACWGMNGGVCPWPAGRGTGGGTIINAMIWTRGNFRDFDGWAAEGNPGWSYEELLPLFKRTEKVLIRNRDPKYRGTSGELPVDYTPYVTPLLKAFLDAGTSKGFDVVDYNNPESHIGFAQLEATMDNGRRVTAATAFLKPILDRANLYISLNSRVTRIIIEPDTLKAIGIEYIKNGKIETAYARKEVIVAAGAFNSPQLLMLSGIGPAEHLTEVGIPVLVNLPVGENLQEHVGMHGLSFLIDEPVSISPLDIIDTILLGGVRYIISRKGPLTSLGCEGVAYTKSKFSNSTGDYPDIELLLVASGLNTDAGLYLRRAFGISDYLYNSVYKEYDGQHAFGIWPMLLYPRSRGRVLLKDRNPLSKVIIYNNFLQDRRDVDILVEALKMAIELAKTPPFRKFGARLINKPFPQCRDLRFGSDEYWDCAVRTMTCQWHHQCGTCKMGTVVDSRLSVINVANLRVADASIMPIITGGHTQAPAYLIGEKAADMIREDWNIPF